VNDVHGAVDVTVHVQSRAVEISSVPDTPAAGAAAGREFSTDT
jgi:hypothetical protein